MQSTSWASFGDGPEQSSRVSVFSGLCRPTSVPFQQWSHAYHSMSAGEDPGHFTTTQQYAQDNGMLHYAPIKSPLPAVHNFGYRSPLLSNGMEPGRPRTCPDLSSVSNLQELTRLYPPSTFERILPEQSHQSYQPWYTCYDQTLESGAKLEQELDNSMAYHPIESSSAFTPEASPASGFLPYHTVPGFNDRMTSAQVAVCENNAEETSAVEDEWDLPYAKLIEKALREAPGHRMVLQDIYEWFKQRRPAKCNDRTRGWQNSIRHNLSMNHAFVKTEHDQAGSKESKKGCVWVLADAALEDGVMSTTRFRNKNPTKRSNKASNPARQASGSKGGKAAKKSLGMRKSERTRAPSPYTRRAPVTRSASRSAAAAHAMEPYYCQGSGAYSPAVAAHSPYPDPTDIMGMSMLHGSGSDLARTLQTTDFRFDDCVDVAPLPEGVPLFYDESEYGEEPPEPRTPPLGFDETLQPMTSFEHQWE